MIKRLIGDLENKGLGNDEKNLDIVYESLCEIGEVCFAGKEMRKEEMSLMMRLVNGNGNEIGFESESEKVVDRYWLVISLIRQEFYRLFRFRETKSDIFSMFGETGEDALRRLFITKHHQLSLFQRKVIAGLVPDVLVNYSFSQRVIIATDKLLDIFSPVVVVQLDVLRYSEDAVQTVIFELSVEELEVFIKVLGTALRNIQKL